MNDKTKAGELPKLKWRTINSDNVDSAGINGFWYNIIIGNAIQLEVKRRLNNIDFCEQTKYFDGIGYAKIYAQLHFENCFKKYTQ